MPSLRIQLLIAAAASCRLLAEALSSPVPSASSAPVVSVSNTNKKHCVVVGGGPVGLAAALTLSNPPHSYNVTLLEQSDGASSVQTYDPTRAYLYLVNPRGLEWMDQFPRALQRLEDKGCISSARNMVLVQGDPSVPIDPQTKVGSAIANMTMDKNTALRSIWVPRHQMIQLLVETCEEQEREQADNEQVGSIKILSGKCVVGVQEAVAASGSAVEVECSDGTSYPATLLVAADGIDSSVRQCLATPGSSWINARPKQFRVKKYKSPSSGVKLKCLQFPPNFTLVNTDGSTVETQSTTIYSIRSTNTGQERFSLGLLPVKDPQLIRPANINTRHDHKAWQITNGPELKAYFERSFPRIPWDSIITNDAEWQRFATAKGTTYPMPQYSPGSAVTNPNNEQVGVVLVGDACHAFPPDIGQGINSGLNDVVALDRCLQGKHVETGKSLEENNENAVPPSLSTALQRYEANRRPEHRALIRLARFGSPYQYRQSWRRDYIGSALWMANASLRMILNKLTFGLIQPVAMTLAFRPMQETTTSGDGRLPYLTYRQIMRRADATTLALKTSATLILVAVCWMLKKRAIVPFL